MNRLWVVDASPIIAMSRVKRIDLLLSLCPAPIIPASVAEEIRSGGAHDPARVWLDFGNAKFVAGAVEPASQVVAWDLGAGETEVISLALQRSGATAILDDLAARKCAQSLNIPVRGTLGIIVLSKQQGLIPSAGPVFKELEDAGLRVDSAVLDKALELAGEKISE